MEIRPMFFQEILFFDFLEESAPTLIRQVFGFEKEKSNFKIFPSQSRPNLHFAKLH
jgi:hypothetical protein